jgi:hypothetical protein
MRYLLAFLIAFILAFPVHAQNAPPQRGHTPRAYYHPPGWSHHSHVTGRPTLIPRYHHRGYVTHRSY